MLWYSPEALSAAIEACKPVTFKATNMCVVHKELQDNGITFWPSFGHRGEHKLCGAYIPINLKSKNIKQKTGIRIRMVPNALQCLPHEWTEADFLQKVCDAFVDITGLKLAYKGDSMASVAHRAIQELEVTQRVHVSPEHKAFFMTRQEGRCGDTFKDTDQVELHHRVALAQGAPTTTTTWYFFMQRAMPQKRRCRSFRGSSRPSTR